MTVIMARSTKPNTASLKIEKKAMNPSITPSRVRSPKVESGDVASPASSSSSDRALRILGMVATRPMLLADLAAELSLPKATVHRICTQLQNTGYLARHVDERYFVAGPALRGMAFDTLNHDSARGIRHMLLTRLVEKVHETCNFTTLDGSTVLYLDRVEAQWPWRFTLSIGSHVPLHCTSSGKLFLALMSPSQREALLSQLPLDRLTPATITDAAELRRECEQIAAQGYALDQEEFVQGLVAMSVPVLDGQGRARGAISMHASLTRLTVDEVVSKLPILRDTAAEMRKIL